MIPYREKTLHHQDDEKNTGDTSLQLKPGVLSLILMFYIFYMVELQEAEKPIFAIIDTL